MYIAVNCLLLMLGTAVLVLGLSFFIRNPETPEKTSLYILLYCITSSVWCISYGLIGITDDFALASVIRVFGVLAIDAFLINEFFFVFRMCRAKGEVVFFIRAMVLILAIIDFIAFSRNDIDIFFRLNNWTTWYSNPESRIFRDIHTVYIVLVFAATLVTGIVWSRNNTLKRQRNFISMVFVANFILLFFCIPDTILPAVGRFAVPTSGIGAAGCSIVMWYAAVVLNSFEIQLGNIVGKMYDFMEAGVLVFDTERRIVMMNPYVKRIIPEDKKHPEVLSDLFSVNEERSGEIFRESLENIIKVDLLGNDKRFYSLRMNAVKDSYGEPYCYLCILVDMTEKDELISRLEEANNAKTDFLTSMSHEIRTPITAIMGFDEIIKRESDQDDIKEYAGHIDLAARHLLSIVNDILDMAQVSSGKLSLKPRNYSPKKMVRNVMLLHEKSAEDKGLSLWDSVDEGIPGVLMGDEVRVQQILINLLTNAIKYTREGSVSVNVSCRNRAHMKTDLIMSVEDTGTGIKDEDIPFLYKVFERFDRDSNTNIAGTGVGLALTKGLIDAMGGTIEVKSVYGRGARFTVTLPQEVVSYDEAVEDDDRDKGRKNCFYVAENAEILVIDDSEMNIEVVKGLLKPSKARIDTGNSGREMLNAIKEKHYDIIFLDHLMPNMDGIEALTRMRADKSHLNQDTPVIVMTANVIKGMKEKFLESGFTDYLEKPIEPELISGMIGRYIPFAVLEEIDRDQEDSALEMSSYLPPIDGIDWNMALSTATNTGMLKEIASSFVRTAGPDTEELQKYYEGIDDPDEEDILSRYRIKVHAMKHSAALIGAAELSAKAKALEMAAKDKRPDFIKENHASFIKEYLRIASDIRSDLFGETDEHRVIDNEMLKEYLDLSEEAMENYDTLALNDIMLSLGEYSFSPESLNEPVLMLKEAVRDFDREQFDRAVTEIRKILEQG